MEITKYGVMIDSFEKNISENFKTANLLSEFDIQLKPESLLANIIVALTCMQNNLEKQIAYLIKQYDPVTAEGYYLDNLYDRVGLQRKLSAPTSFNVQVTGDARTSVDSGSLILVSQNGEHIFYNSAPFDFDENGYATVNMQSFLNDFVPIDTNSILRIADAPQNVYSLVENTISNIVLGITMESDTDYRKRFKNYDSANVKCTRDALLNNLSKLTGGIGFVTVNDNNSDDNIPAGAIKITAKPVVSDEEFAEAILLNTVAGLSYVGNTSVDVVFDDDQTIEVKYNKANDVLIDVLATVHLKSGFYPASVFNKVRGAILNYLQNKSFGLKSTIYSSLLIPEILGVNGIEAVISVSIRRNNLEYTDCIYLSDNEVPIFNIANIVVECDDA